MRFVWGTRDKAGVSITHFAGRTLPLKYSNFQQIYKKLSQFYKKINFDKIGAKSRKQCSIRMLVGLHTHYQMHLASKFTLFFLWNLTQLRLFTFKYSWILWKRTLFYKKLPCFIKNCIWPTYKKLQPPKSAIIRNSIFVINRDPWNMESV